MYTSLPPKQGLYDPWFEHDACGLGVVANIKGRKSNKILRQALVVLRNMDHRGGQGADMNSGDARVSSFSCRTPFWYKMCQARYRTAAARPLCRWLYVPAA
mgnify:CR=1 FL=1